jgi:hypothetical protein
MVRDGRRRGAAHRGEWTRPLYSLKYTYEVYGYTMYTYSTVCPSVSRRRSSSRVVSRRLSSSLVDGVAHRTHARARERSIDRSSPEDVRRGFRVVCACARGVARSRGQIQSTRIPLIPNSIGWIRFSIRFDPSARAWVSCARGVAWRGVAWRGVAWRSHRVEGARAWD